METIAILLTAPAAFAAAIIYRSIILYAADRFPWLVRPLKVASYAFLALASEWLMLNLHGAIGTRLILGPIYYPIHSLLFLFATPALINALIFPNPLGPWARWYSVALAPTVMALVVVIQQYAVSESLFGIDADNGPFSNKN